MQKPEETCYCAQLSYEGTKTNPHRPLCGLCYAAKQRETKEEIGPRNSKAYLCLHRPYHPIPTLGRHCWFCMPEMLAEEQIIYELAHDPFACCMRAMLESRLRGVYRLKSSCCGFRAGKYLCFCHYSPETTEIPVIDLLERKNPGYRLWLSNYDPKERPKYV